MKRLLLVFAFLALLILPQATQAQLTYDENQLRKVEKFYDLVAGASGQLEYDKSQLRKIEKIHVMVAGASGCITAPNVLKVEAELILRRSGITVTGSDEYPTDGVRHSLIFTAEDRKLGTTRCVVALNLSLVRNERLEDGTLGIVFAAWDQLLFIEPQTDFENHIRTQINLKVTELANEILIARRR